MPTLKVLPPAGGGERQNLVDFTPPSVWGELATKTAFPPAAGGNRSPPRAWGGTAPPQELGGMYCSWGVWSLGGGERRQLHSTALKICYIHRFLSSLARNSQVASATGSKPKKIGACGARISTSDDFRIVLQSQSGVLEVFGMISGAK